MRAYGGSSGERTSTLFRVLVAGGPELKRAFDLGYEIYVALSFVHSRLRLPEMSEECRTASLIEVLAFE
jgi:hypothetical protein